MELSHLNFRDKEPIQNTYLKEINYQLSTRGYGIVPSYLLPKECETFKLHLNRSLSEYDPNGPGRKSLEKEQLHDLITRNIAYCRLLEDPRLQQLVSLSLTKFWIMYAFTTSSLPPNGSNYAARIHVDSPRWIPNYTTNISVMITLDDFSTETGATRILPGSQHLPETPTQELFDKCNVEILCPPGSLILFNSRTFHRAGFNSSSRWRHALSLNACRPYMKQRMEWVRMVPKEFSEQLNSQARRIIGFDTRLPTSMDEYFVPEDKLLYLPGQEQAGGNL